MFAPETLLFKIEHIFCYVPFCPHLKKNRSLLRTCHLNFCDEFCQTALCAQVIVPLPFLGFQP